MGRRSQAADAAEVMVGEEEVMGGGGHGDGADDATSTEPAATSGGTAGTADAATEPEVTPASTVASMEVSGSETEDGRGCPAEAGGK